MPYISEENRVALNEAILQLGAALSTMEGFAGNLNYSVSKIINNHLNHKGLNYANLNEIVGVLDCIKMELYRRVAAPYEDLKIQQNGDVYDC